MMREQGTKREYLDVLDSRGCKTGKRLPKDDVHYQGKWFGSAHVWIYNSSGDVLLQQRSRNKKAQPLKWGVSCGGHIASGETPLKSAMRELREETGLTLPRKAFKKIGVRKSYGYEPDAKWYSREFISIYLVRYDGSAKLIKRQKSEVEKLEFVSISTFTRWIANNRTRRKFMNYSKSYYLFAIREIRKALKQK